MPDHTAKNRIVAEGITPPADCRSPRSNPLPRRSGIVATTLAAMTVNGVLHHYVDVIMISIPIKADAVRNHFLVEHLDGDGGTCQ